MKKDHIRDYATEAFRYYAACGCPTSEQVKEQIYTQISERSSRDYTEVAAVMSTSSATEYGAMAAEDAFERHKAEILDILAVEKALAELRYDPAVIRAIEMVYFPNPDKELRKGDISDRVHVAELMIPASERTIYYWLKKARKIFARHRGLRIF